VVRIANTEKQPTKIVRPVYPREASEHWIQGRVVLDVVIGKNGTVKMLGRDEYDCLSPTILVQAAADAVRQWRWEPLLVNGKPVRVRTKISVNFVLDETSLPISVCNVIRDPSSFDARTVNLSGTVRISGGLKLLSSAECSSSVVIADQADGGAPVKDDRYVAFEEAVSSSPVPACVRGVFQVDNSPGELRVQRLILGRVLKCSK
jgi:Gram-negative bacterial TonB protein C-terminal